MITKTLKIVGLAGYPLNHHDFYRPLDWPNNIAFEDVSLCAGGVAKLLGLPDNTTEYPQQVQFKLTQKKPGGKGWRKINPGRTGGLFLRKHRFGLHSRLQDFLVRHNVDMQSSFWVKATPITESK